MHTYNPQRVVVVVVSAAAILPLVLGPIIDLPSVLDTGPVIRGFSTGTFIRAMRRKPSSRLVDGCDGEVTKVLGRNRSGEIELVLDAYAASNEYLSVISAQDELTGTGLCSIGIYDRGSRFAACIGLNASIEKPADFTRGDKHGRVTWKLLATRLNTVHSRGKVVSS